MKIIWVATDGSDYIGNGSYVLPYLTIEQALSVFESGDQIRLKDGTYNPIDSIVIFGMEGSIFADTPLGATIQPYQTVASTAVIEVSGSSRFGIYGVNILQALDGSNNMMGIYGHDVDNFIVHTCTISDFEVSLGLTSTVGIAVSGSGQVENCNVYSLAAGGDYLYGIMVNGLVHVTDCSVYSLSGAGPCVVRPISVGGVLHTV